MKLTKKKGDNSTIRKVWNDDKTEALGIVGTFRDLLAFGVVEDVSGCSLDFWCCIPNLGRIDTVDGVGETREQAISNTKFGKRREYKICDL